MTESPHAMPSVQTLDSERADKTYKSLENLYSFSYNTFIPNGERDVQDQLEQDGGEATGEG